MTRIPRVGGGYAHDHTLHPYKFSEVPRAENNVEPLKDAQHKVSRTFDGHGVTALVTVQGGAVVWTAEGTGDVFIRNPITGETQSSVKRAKRANIGVMEEVDSCILAGCDDGGVELYDHYLGEEMVRQVEHATPVVAIAPLRRDARAMYAVSLSTDSLVGWCHPPTDDVTLDVVGKCVFSEYTDSPPESLAVSPDGEFIFVGFADGTVFMIAGADLEVEGQWQAHPAASVSALCHSGEVLFSGGSDGHIRAWDTDSQRGGILVYDGEMHNAPVRKITCESAPDYLPGDEQVVVSIADNCILRWKWNHGRPHHLSADNEPGITAYSGYNVWDGMRLWTFSSNGRALPWFSTRYKSNDTKREAEEQLKALVAHEDKEIKRWQHLVDTQVRKVRRLEGRTCAMYLDNNVELHGLTLRYYRTWQEYVLRRLRARRAIIFLEFLEPRSKQDRYLRYYRKLELHMRIHQSERRRATILRHIMLGCEQGLRRLYWQKLTTYARQQAAQERARKACEFLGYKSTTFILGARHRVWALYAARRKKQRVAEQYAMQVAGQNTTHLRHRYYHQWWRYASDAKETRMMTRRMGILAGEDDRLLLMRSYSALRTRAFARIERRRKLTRRAEMLSAQHGNALRARYYRMWRLRAHEVTEGNTRRQIAGAQKQIDYLRGQTGDKYKHLFERRDELLGELEPKQARKRELLARKAELRLKVDRLTEDLRKRKRAQSIIAKYDDIMAKLKELSLNFERDRTLILKCCDKAKAASAARTFLESHMEIKGAVVRSSGQSNLGKDDLWPMEKVKKRLKDHEWRQIVIAIKVMVVAFDLLTRKDIAELDTDDEIILNGQNLIDLFQTALDKKVVVR